MSEASEDGRSVVPRLQHNVTNSEGPNAKLQIRHEDIEIARPSKDQQPLDDESKGVAPDSDVVEPQQHHAREWTHEESQLLFQFEKQFGTCWSKIGRMIGRMGNSVKNHYYSAFRRATRLLNRFVSTFCKDIQIKCVTNRMLLSIISATEDSRQGKCQLSPPLVKKCQAIKDHLSKYTIQHDKFEPNEVIELVREVSMANQQIKLQKSKHKKSVIDSINKKHRVSSKDMGLSRRTRSIPSVPAPRKPDSNHPQIVQQPVMIHPGFQVLPMMPLSVLPLQPMVYYWY